MSRIKDGNILPLFQRLRAQGYVEISSVSSFASSGSVVDPILYAANAVNERSEYNFTLPPVIIGFDKEPTSMEYNDSLTIDSWARDAKVILGSASEAPENTLQDVQQIIRVDVLDSHPAFITSQDYNSYNMSLGKYERKSVMASNTVLNRAGGIGKVNIRVHFPRITSNNAIRITGHAAHHDDMGVRFEHDINEMEYDLTPEDIYNCYADLEVDLGLFMGQYAYQRDYLENSQGSHSVGKVIADLEAVLVSRSSSVTSPSLPFRVTTLSGRTIGWSSVSPVWINRLYVDGDQHRFEVNFKPASSPDVYRSTNLRLLAQDYIEVPTRDIANGINTGKRYVELTPVSGINNDPDAQLGLFAPIVDGSIIRYKPMVCAVKGGWLFDGEFVADNQNSDLTGGVYMFAVDFTTGYVYVGRGMFWRNGGDWNAVHNTGWNLTALPDFELPFDPAFIGPKPLTYGFYFSGVPDNLINVEFGRMYIGSGEMYRTPPQDYEAW